MNPTGRRDRKKDNAFPPTLGLDLPILPILPSLTVHSIIKPPSVKVKVKARTLEMARGTQERFVRFDLRSWPGAVVSRLVGGSVGLESRPSVGGLMERVGWAVVDGALLSCPFGDGVTASGSVPYSVPALPSLRASSTSIFLFPTPLPFRSPFPSRPKTHAPLSSSTARTPPFPSSPNLSLTPATPSHKALYSPTPYAILLPHSPPQQTHQYSSSAKNGAPAGS